MQRAADRFLLRFFRKEALLLLLAVAAGCTPPSGANFVPPAIGTGTPQAANFATELAGPDTYLPPLPTAVVLLRPDDMERNRAFCRASLSLPTVQQAVAASVVAPNLIHTRWLVQIADIPPARATDCDFLTGTYDYARAARLIASVHPTNGKFYGRGPYLLMFIPDRKGMYVAGLDGSGVPTGSMSVFIDGWGRALARSQAQIASVPQAQPGVVRSLFDLIGAVLRTVVGGAVGLVTGVVDNA